MPNNEALTRKWFPYVSATALFLVSSIMVMLGPILVPIATDLHTTLAMAGQLATVTSLIWGFAAIPIGPVSDTYGRRLVLLTGLGLMIVSLLAAALAQSYGAMLAARILTGFAAAMIPPTCYAACADQLSATHAARALSWTMAGGVLGGALGMSLVAWLANLGNWHTPFWFFAGAITLMWLAVWIIVPRHVAAPGKPRSMLSNFREIGSRGSAFWLLLFANFLLQSASWGTLSYLPAYLMQTYHQPMGAIALPLLLHGCGVMSGALGGGPLAANPKRSGLVLAAIVVAGPLIALAFWLPLSPWATVAITSVAGGLFILSQPTNMTLLLKLAGSARGTATGFFALSTQLGAMSGAAVGGVMLSIGGFAWVGLGCMAIGTTAAIVMARCIKGRA